MILIEKKRLSSVTIMIGKIKKSRSINYKHNINYLKMLILFKDIMMLSTDIS